MVFFKGCAAYETSEGFITILATLETSAAPDVPGVISETCLVDLLRVLPTTK